MLKCDLTLTYTIANSSSGYTNQFDCKQHVLIAEAPYTMYIQIMLTTLNGYITDYLAGQFKDVRAV